MSRKRPLTALVSNSGGPLDEAKIISGNISSRLPRLTQPVIRIFISSTFSDMTYERNALMKNAYPVLKEYCRSNHLEFQIIDLRWGIRDQSHEDHSVIDFCLKEIDKCQEDSIGPNFFVLLGQKYGFRPVPPTILADEFETIMSELEKGGQDTSLVARCYAKDTNVLPNVYRTLPKHLIFGKAHSEDEWANIFIELRNIFRAGANLCRISGSIPRLATEKYFTSVTEYEIEKGLLQRGEKPLTESLVFLRKIIDLEEKLSTSRATRYIDVLEGDGGRSRIDADAQGMLNELAYTKIAPLLGGKENFERFEVRWEDESKSPNDNEAYLNQLCQTFVARTKSLIDKSLLKSSTSRCDRNLVDIIQHLTAAKQLTENFVGRNNILSRVRLMIEKGVREPIVLFGTSGSGKSAIAAKIISLVFEWMAPKCQPYIIARFLGTTLRSSSLLLTLESICWQAAQLYGQNFEETHDYQLLLQQFYRLIAMATAKKPLVIILDGLNHVTSKVRIYKLAWMLCNLPSHVTVIVSVASDMPDIIATFRQVVVDQRCLVQVDPLSRDLCLDIVHNELSAARRTLTKDQWTEVKRVLRNDEIPLYAVLVSREICEWASFTTETTLEANTLSMMHRLLDRVERYYGYLLVAHCLSYIVASRAGLSLPELEDLLSLDDHVLNEVFQHWTPPIRRLPPVLLYRLRDRLHGYLVEREVDSIGVVTVKHRQFADVVAERYLTNEKRRNYVHSLLAHYYLGTWSGTKRKKIQPLRRSEDDMGSVKITTNEAERMVSYQPLVFRHAPSRQPSSEVYNCNSLPIDAIAKDDSKSVYNIRKLSQLPHHLINAGMSTELKLNVCFNCHWLIAKYSAMSVYELLQDFQEAIESDLVSTQNDIQLLAAALRQTIPYLDDDSNSLLFHLTGRLLPHYNEIAYKPAAKRLQRNRRHVVAFSRHDEDQDLKEKTVVKNYVKHFVDQCDLVAVKRRAFVPLIDCFDSPEPTLRFVLFGHATTPSDFAFCRSTMELISASTDRVIFWDIDTGEMTRSITFEGRDRGARSIHLTENEKFLVVVNKNNFQPMLTYSVENCQLVSSFSGEEISTRQCQFSGLIAHDINFYNIATGKRVAKFLDFSKSQKYTASALTADGSLFCVCEQSELVVHDFILRKQIFKLKFKTHIFCLAISRDGHKLFAGCGPPFGVVVVDIDRSAKNFGKRLTTIALTDSQPPSEIKSNDLANVRRMELIVNGVIVDDDVILAVIGHAILVVVEVASEKRTNLSTSCLPCSKESLSIVSARFSSDGLIVLAVVSEYLILYSLKTGQMLNYLNYQDRKNFAYLPFADCLATASSTSTAVKVWHMTSLPTSDKPVNINLCRVVKSASFAASAGLVFIHFAYTHRADDFFSVETKNVFDGTLTVLLPLDHYGQLLYMTADPAGVRLALLVENESDYDLYVVDTRSGRVVFKATNESMRHCVVANNWNFLALENDEVLRLRDTIRYDVINDWPDCRNARFTDDSRHLLFQSRVGSDAFIDYVNLDDMRIEFRVSYDSATIYCPLDNLALLAQSPSDDDKKWRIIDVASGSCISSGSGNIIVASNQSHLVVDDQMRVTDVSTGHSVSYKDSLKNDSVVSKAVFASQDRVVVWADGQILVAASTRQRRIVDRVNLGEDVTFIECIHRSPYVVVGGGSGHLFVIAVDADDEIDPEDAEECFNDIAADSSENGDGESGYGVRVKKIVSYFRRKRKPENDCDDCDGIFTDQSATSRHYLEILHTILVEENRRSSLKKNEKPFQFQYSIVPSRGDIKIKKKKVPTATLR